MTNGLKLVLFEMSNSEFKLTQCLYILAPFFLALLVWYQMKHQFLHGNHMFQIDNTLN